MVHFKFLFFIIIACIGCSTFKASDNMFWGELESGQNYLLRNPNTEAISDGELDPGSIVLFGENEGDFTTVYLTNPKKKNKKIKYYIHKPKYNTVTINTSSNLERLVHPKIETNRSYSTGTRGGCFYLNGSNNKVYVDKSFCHSKSSYSLTPSLNSSSSKSTGGSTYVKGHYRKTKSVKTVYVKPHRRKN